MTETTRMTGEMTRTVDVPVGDGYTITVKGTFFDRQLDGMNLLLSPPDDGRKHGEPQDVSIGQLKNIEAVVRAMTSMLPAVSTHDPHYDIGPVFIPVATMLNGIMTNDLLLPEQPIAEAVNVLCGRAIGQLNRSMDALPKHDRPNDLEYHYANAFLTAIGVLALIGRAKHEIHPEGGIPAQRIGPDPDDAIAYADLLCDVARERWPAPPASWYEKPGDDDAEAEGGGDGEPKDDDSLAAVYTDLEAESISAVHRANNMLAEAKAAEDRADALVRRMEAIERGDGAA